VSRQEFGVSHARAMRSVAGDVGRCDAQPVSENRERRGMWLFALASLQSSDLLCADAREVASRKALARRPDSTELRLALEAAHRHGITRLDRGGIS
jgi:hypothetical protein